MDWRRDQADFCLGPMLSKNALPQITCCGGGRFHLLLAGRHGLVGISSELPCHLCNRRAYLICWRAEQTERHRLEILDDGGAVRRRPRSP